MEWIVLVPVALLLALALVAVLRREPASPAVDEDQTLDVQNHRGDR